MFTVFVFYGQPDDADAFGRHYEQTHTPLAQKIPGLKRFEATQVVGTPDGTPSPYHLVVALGFDSAEDAQQGLQSAEGQAAIEDLANFATGGVTGVLGPTQSLL